MVFGDIKNKLSKFSNAEIPFDTIKEVIDENTFKEMRRGKIYVSDEIVNKEIARRIETIKDKKISLVQVTSTQDGKLNIAVQLNGGKNILLSGNIDILFFNNGVGVFLYNVETHEMVGSSITSWIFSSLTLGFMQKIIGLDVQLDYVDVKTDGNNIIVDFSRLLLESPLGKFEFKGLHAIDLLEIKKAVSVKGGTELIINWKGREIAKEKIKLLWGNMNNSTDDC